MEERNLIDLIYNRNLSGENIRKLFQYLLERQNVEEINIDIEFGGENEGVQE